MPLPIQILWFYNCNQTATFIPSQQSLVQQSHRISGEKLLPSSSLTCGAKAPGINVLFSISYSDMIRSGLWWLSRNVKVLCWAFLSSPSCRIQLHQTSTVYYQGTTLTYLQRLLNAFSVACGMNCVGQKKRAFQIQIFGERKVNEREVQ